MEMERDEWVCGLILFVLKIEKEWKKREGKTERKPWQEELLLAEIPEVEAIAPQGYLRARERTIDAPTRPKHTIPHPIGDKAAPGRKKKKKRRIFFFFF